jgi:GAF domain-containing protein
LTRHQAVLGAIQVYRTEVRPFSGKQIALLQNFAAQAVIAMENARLLTETREGLEQQTATAEVLQVINSSPGNLGPVFDALLQKAMELCGASIGGLSTYDGERFSAVATRGLPPALVDFFRNPYSVNPQSYFGQIVSGKTVLHVTDLGAESLHDAAPLSRAGVGRGRAFVELGNARTGLFLALRRENVLLGILWFYRQEVRPFSEKQIAVLQNFAAQAVIAMENARLINETREALDQQTASAEVLQVINSSPGNLVPVFESMLDKAMRLCNAAYGHLYTYDGERVHPVAMRGEADFVDWLRQVGPCRPAPGSPVERTISGESVVHIADALQEDAYRTSPGFKKLIDFSGIRTGVTVALRKEDTLLGAINIYRKEVRPFSEKQIALLENFAAQAVIAIENARLLTETREALAQQTATAEVLQAINSSPGDLGPVWDEMLDRATRICEATFGALLTWDGERLHWVAFRGVPAGLIDALQPV